MKKRIFSLLIALVLCCSFFVGCGEEEATATKRSYNGTHILTATETEEYMVKDGKTDYRILIPSDFDTHTKMASSELQTFFKQATGITLIIDFETGEGVTHTADAKYISIGDTKMLESANFNGDDITENDYDKEKLTKDGLRILTKDKTVYLIGGESTGTVNAVYDFLQIMFNYEFYFFDCWEIDEGVLNAKLLNFNVTDIPDIVHRNAPWSAINNSYDNFRYRARNSMTDCMLAIGDIEHGYTRTTFHNTSEILPPAAPTTEGEWLSDNGDQLCYTAHGDPDSYQRMVERTVKVVIDCMKDQKVGTKPNLKVFTISHEDNGAICGCAACLSEKTKYGAASGSVILFLNNVMTLLHEKMDEALASDPEGAKSWVRKDMYCVYFAYGSFVRAPSAEIDEETGKYVPVHSELTFHPQLGTYFAINNLDYANDIYYHSNNSARKNMEVTFDLANIQVLWTYNVNFSNYLEPVNSFNFFNTNGYSFLASGNAFYMYNQANFNQPGLTSFQTLKIYLDSKCFWDSSLDTEQLTLNYFEAMFGETKDIMMRLWNEERNYDDMLMDKTTQREAFSFMRTINRAEWWPAHMLIRWMALCEEAMEVAEKAYKNTDPEKYEQILYHIEQEYVMPCYYLAYLHKKDVVGEKWVDAAKFLKYTAADKLPTYCINQSGASLNKDWRNLVV